MAKTSPAEFAREVRQEARKITWPSRRETVITTGMVFLMVIAASIFLFMTDQVIAWALRLALGIGA